ncbi:MAG: patatin-like phospholipase family protein [Steroidobacteraceae bacterium]
MLTLEPARQRRAGRSKLAIALAGGGPLGAFYELGALHALSEGIIGRALTDFDIYVGVSSGSVVAAALANDIDTTAMGSIFIHNTATILPLTPDILLTPAVGEYARRMARLPEVLVDCGQAFLRDPLQGLWPGLMSSLGRVLPTAIFDIRPLERYLRTIFSAGDRTDDFRRLRARLFVVATNLNTGASVAFGDDAHDDVPISRAVAASAALPGLYAAVDIGGEHYVDGALIRTMHASLALEADCDLVICINPLVPFDAAHDRSGPHAELTDAGLPVILGQTFRALIHSRMQVGMATYRARFPKADQLLLQPDRDDARLFFANVFRYSGRESLVEHAYQRTRRDLLAQARALSAVLERRGLSLDVERLRDKTRFFSTAAKERNHRSRRVAARLGDTLGRLEQVLG